MSINKGWTYSIDVPDSTLPGHLLRIRDIQEGIGETDEIYNKIQEDRGYLEEQYNRYEPLLANLPRRVCMLSKLKL